ncbi:Uncharacterised protein [Mycobacteroides abscessus subsp. abscessus]|nr:Uncharacterised protein [Mycobacteroides abscessus subsp. abscessus]
MSLLNEPPASTNTMTGAFPPCWLAKASATSTAFPLRIQSLGVLNSPPIIMMVGNSVRVESNQAGGR